jgi:hypothetical protein
MSDTEQAETPKRPPGRRRKAPSHVVREPQRMPRGVDEDDVLSCKTELYSHHDPLHFPAEVLWQMEHEYGYCGEWAAFENCGVPVRNLTIRLQQGFQQATRNSFQGLLKPYVAKRDGPIIEGGLAFVVIPKPLYLKLKGLEHREAVNAKEQMKRSHMTEGVSGITMPEGNSPAALAKNRHQQSFEQGPRIPD